MKIFKFTFIFIFTFLLSSVSAQKKLSPEIERQINEQKTQLAQYQSENNNSLAANALNKIANIYWMNDDFENAADYFKQSLVLNKIIGNKNAIAVINNNLGLIYSDLNNFNLALSHFLQAHEIKQKSGNKQDLATSFINIASTYISLGKNIEAINYLENGILNAKETSNSSTLKSLYTMLAETYRKAGNSEKSFQNLELARAFDKQITKEKIQTIEQQSQNKVSIAESQKNLTQKQLSETSGMLKITTDSLETTKHLTSEQKLMISLLEKDKKLQKLELEATKTAMQIRLIAIFGLAIIAVLLLMLFSFYKRNNRKLHEQNIILQKQKEEIQKQKELLIAQNKKITDSINYASRIQEAILPSKKAIKHRYPESFIFYRPKEIVSGDFYWFSQVKHRTYIATVDCTGHSVPGAFMSMIGNTLLNEIVNQNNILNPASILTKLDEGVKYSLKQNTESADRPSDGMDITLCCYNSSTKMLEIACANHHLVVIADGKMEVINGDINSIGGEFSTMEDKEFTTFQRPINSLTTVYMYSDGYQDQFGGEKRKKFTVPRLHRLFFENYHLQMSKQQEIVEDTFNNWQNDLKQIDDVLIIGFVINPNQP